MTGSWDWDAAAGWLGHSAAAGGAVLLAGWLAARAVAGPARRAAVLGWAVRAAVLAPVLCLLPAWLTLPVPAAWAASRAAAVAPADPPPPADAPAEAADWDWAPDSAGDDAPVGPAAAAPRDPAAGPGRDSGLGPPNLAAVVVVGYGLVAGGLLLQLAAGQVGLCRLVRRGRPAPARVRRVFDGLAAGAWPAPRLLVSDRVPTPVCFGVFRPTVVIPRGLAAAGTPDELRWVFAHELDHVRRGDPAAGLWAGAARALFWFVPWLGAVRRDLALAQEYLADAAAASAGGRPADYAAFLVRLSGDPPPAPGRRRARVPAGAHGVRAGKSDLFRRVTMVLETDPRAARRASRGWAAGAAAVALATAVGASGLGLAADDPPKPPAPPAEKADKVTPPAPPAGPAPPAPPARPAVADLKRRIAEAADKGDVAEVKRLADQLGREAAGARQPARRVEVEADAARADAMRAQADAMRAQMDAARKQIEKAFEGMKDRPEVREQLEKALDGYRRAAEAAKDRLPKDLADPDKLKDLADPERLKELGRLREFRVVPQGRFEFRGAPGGFDAPVGREARPRFGVRVGEVTEALAEQLDLAKGKGAVVAEVVPGSPADKAGVKKNDVILSLGGREVNDPQTLVDAVAAAKPGAKVDVVIFRKGKQETLKGVDLPEPPKPAQTKRPARADTVTIQVTDGDTFRIDARKAGVGYRVAGKIEDGKAVPNTIRVTAPGEKPAEYKSVADVPEEHRAAVEGLLKGVGGTSKR